MESSVLLGVLRVVAISLVPVGIMAAALHVRRLRDLLVALARRLRLRRPAPELPVGPPLEKLAADLRRLHPRAHHPHVGVGMARQRGIVASYDGVLLATARALEVPTTLADLPDGFDREAERLRLEHALTRAGISWQVHDR